MNDNQFTNLTMLEISSVMMGRVETIYPTLVWDDQRSVLIDTGYPGQQPLISKAMHKHGFSMNRLSHIIITHQDIDHIGSLPAIIEHIPHAVQVLANELEKPYIEGHKRLIKITPEAIAQAEATLPADIPEQWRKAFISNLTHPPRAQVDATLTDGEELSIGGGLIVINTPGHTPGHISLYHKPTRTLIAADALRVVNGQLVAPDPQQTVDMPLALESIRKLTNYDIRSVICYHGGRYDMNVNETIAKLSNQTT